MVDVCGWLFVVLFCLLFVVRYLLSVVCSCVMRVVCCSLVDYRLLFVACCLPNGVRCVLLVVCCRADLWFVIRWHLGVHR